MTNSSSKCLFSFSILCILTFQNGFAQPIKLEDALVSEEMFEFRELTQGYHGRYDKVLDEAGIEPRRGAEPFEYTHVRRTDHGGKITKPVIELVVCGKDRSDCRAPTAMLQNVPAFTTLKKQKTIADFERIFGKFSGFTDAWGLESVLYSSKTWLVFVPRESGELRVVEVFLQTINRGDGWQIDKRQIREGLFRPTNMPPVPEEPAER